MVAIPDRNGGRQPGIAPAEAKARARELASKQPTEEAGVAFARSLTLHCIRRYMAGRDDLQARSLPASRIVEYLDALPMEGEALELSEKIGAYAAGLDVLSASYVLGTIYTAALPPHFRKKHGVYYTPPRLTEQLLNMAERAGVDWRSARVLDPACGGGAFLAPVSLRIAEAHQDNSSESVLQEVEQRVYGFEIDAFGAWMAHAFVNAALARIRAEAGRDAALSIHVQDTLTADLPSDTYDLVVANPPYGRISLDAETRKRYSRSLYGHANLYGLFTDYALQVLSENGVIAYVTPTSFLSGRYYKNLRETLAAHAPPLEIDFVPEREGVFDDVLQETLLVVYKKSHHESNKSVVAEIDAQSEAAYRLMQLRLPERKEEPWIIPRDRQDVSFVARLQELPHRLRDYGYRVSTGPLVWNRHKDQLSPSYSDDCYPIVWAESVRPSGEFIFSCDKKHHKPYLHLRDKNDEWLIVDRPCVLVQRTTAKEQRKRLVSALLSPEFIAKWKGVSVENHLNMVFAVDDKARVTTQLLSTILNTDILDRVFRNINGSVAVSAFELESLPLPPPSIFDGLSSDAPSSDVSALLQAWYGE